jgi:ribosomal protein L10
MGDELHDKRQSLEREVGFEITRLTSAITDLSSKVGQIELGLAVANLTELRTDLRAVKETLLRHDLKELYEKVDRHDRQITRAVAVLVFLQIAVGLFAALSRFIFS